MQKTPPETSHRASPWAGQHPARATGKVRGEADRGFGGDSSHQTSSLARVRQCVMLCDTLPVHTGSHTHTASPLTHARTRTEHMHTRVCTDLREHVHHADVQNRMHASSHSHASTRSHVHTEHSHACTRSHTHAHAHMCTHTYRAQVRCLMVASVPPGCPQQ